MARFSKVSLLYFYTDKPLTKEVLQEVRRKFPGQPKNMDYRKEFIKGRGASTKDKTWNRSRRVHNCCLSRAAWRHRAKCKTLTEEGNEKWKELNTPSQ